MLRRLAEQWILVITYPTHTSGIFQVLERLTFGAVKGVKRSLSKRDDRRPAADHGRKIFVVYERATVSDSVRGAWVQTWFNYIKRDGICYLEVGEPRRREFAEFCEIWDIDFPEE
jgi:hypothetical protein